MKIKPQIAIVASIVIAITGVIITHILGLWTTVSTKVPQKYEQSAFESQYNPADIRGSYTFSEISQLFQIPLEDLSSAFLVEPNAAGSYKCKDLESSFKNAPYEIGTGSVRLFTAFYLGLPFDLTGDTYLPAQAAQILKEKGNMKPEQLSYLESHSVTVPAA